MSEPLTEEPFDRYLNRPLAKPVVWMLVPTPVTANQVTLFAAFLGIAAGVALAFGTTSARIAALLLCWGAFVLDCADGQLARARGGGSRFGYLLDGVADYVIAAAAHVGFIVLALSEPAFAQLPPALVVLLVVGCGGVMAVHSNAFEAVKFRYRATLGESPGWHVKKQAEILADLEGESGLLALVARKALGAYHAGQKKMNERAETAGPVSAADFLLATTLGPTLRLFVLMLSALAAAWWPEAIWAYPIYALGVSNLAFLVLKLRGAV